jgi:ubiquinone/menaquinone biosynthesis C-methylase UbiE
MIRNKQDFFNERAERWDENDDTPGEKYRRVIKEAMIQKEQNILDAGAGTGVIIPYILEVTGTQSVIFAIDFAEKMVEQIKKKSFPDNVKPLIMDVQKTGFENSFFDRIILNSCYPHLDEKEKVLQEIYRIMKKNGIGIICHPAGRERVNRCHRKIHPSVKNDIIPEMNEMKGIVESCGFSLLRGIDEENFFLLSFTR